MFFWVLMHYKATLIHKQINIWSILQKFDFREFLKKYKGGPLESFSVKNALLVKIAYFDPLDGSKTVFGPHFHFLSLILLVSST